MIRANFASHKGRYGLQRGCSREAIVKITRAEPGGLEAKGLWRPAALGIRPRYETVEMKQYLAGGYLLGNE